MKQRIGIFVLTAIVLLATVSCKKMFGDSDDPECGMLLKLKDEKYANYLSFVYSDKKNYVVGYPSPEDAHTLNSYYPNAKCPNGYYFKWGYDAKHHIHDCYTDITIKEYRDIWEATKNKDIRDTLTSRVISRDPYEELYSIPYDTVFWKHKDNGVVGLNFDKINEMIESGELFTYEGVERVK